MLQAGEKLAVQDKTKGDVIMSLVPLIDNFEAAKNAIKVQSDAEQKIVDSYQVENLPFVHGISGITCNCQALQGKDNYERSFTYVLEAAFTVSLQAQCTKHLVLQHSMQHVCKHVRRHNSNTVHILCQHLVWRHILCVKSRTSLQ